MQRRWTTSLTLAALALPLALAASACDEDNVSARTEDKSGINDVPPPSGANGAGNAVGAAVGPSAVSAGAGPTTAVGPGGGSGDGGAGGAGDGGAGGAGGAGGGATTGGGEVGSCALFPMNFQPPAECVENPEGLASITDEFTPGDPILAPFGCADATTTSEVVISARDVLLLQASPECADPIARTPSGFLRGCAAQVTVPAGSGMTEARFGLRNLAATGEQADWGTISVVVTQAASNVTVTAERFGPDASGANPMSTVLGIRPGETLPLRLFVADDPVSGQTCAGVVRAGEYICVGCWTGDEHTDVALDAGSLVLTTSDGVAAFDKLNLEEPGLSSPP